MNRQKKRTTDEIQRERRAERRWAKREANAVRRAIERVETGDPTNERRRAETDVLPMRDAFGVAFDPTAERDPVDRTDGGDRPLRSSRMDNREPRGDVFVRDVTGVERRVRCVTRRPGPDGEPAEFAVRTEGGNEFVVYGGTPVRVVGPVPIR